MYIHIHTHSHTNWYCEYAFPFQIKNYSVRCRQSFVPMFCAIGTNKWFRPEIAIFHETAKHLISRMSARKYTGEFAYHYSDVIMGVSITGVSIVYPSIFSGADPRKHKSSASQAFGVGNSAVNSPHKGPVMRKMFLFDGVIMQCAYKCLIT